MIPTRSPKQILRAIITLFRRLPISLVLSFPLRLLHVVGRQLWCLLRSFTSSRRNGQGIACSSVSGNVSITPATAVVQQGSHSPLPSPSTRKSTSSSYFSLPPDLALRKKLVPCTAKKVRRYHNRAQVPDRGANGDPIPALQRQYSSPVSDDWWEPRVHPEGALFFLDDHRVSRIFTDTNLQTTLYRKRIDRYANELYHWYQQVVEPINSIDIVLQLNKTEQDEVCEYYLVDHDNKTIFWLQEMPLGDVTQGIKEVTALEHIGYAIRAQYWTHCELYPIGRGPQDKITEGLMLELVYAQTEMLTSSANALSPFNAEELATLSDIVDRIILAVPTQKTLPPPYTYPPHHMWALARIMGIFTQTKFYNFCGQPWARLNADQRIYYKKKSNFVVTAFSFALNILSFGAVHLHMAQIRKIWVERSVSFLRWKDFNAELSNEWSSITIYSTVMLAVDVSFLAVPTIPPSPSVAVLATQISVICIMGSIVTSVFLSLQNRRYGRKSADVAAEFLLKMTGSMFGTKALSFVYSLPLALLAWGMLSFGLAFSYFMFISHIKVALITAGCGGLIVIMLISWPVWRQVYWLFAKLFTKRTQVAACGPGIP